MDKNRLTQLTQQFETVHQYVKSELKEEIPDELKKLLLGTFFNLTFEHKKQWSSPQQVVAEYLFSLINTQYCLPQITDFKHRNHILAKTLRTNNWKTPKGFYKHFYLGQNFRDKQKIRERQEQERKGHEVSQSSHRGLSQKSEVLMQVEQQIIAKGSLIKGLTQSIYQQKSEEAILLLRGKIKVLKQELDILYDRQWFIEKELEDEMNTTKWCA